MAQPTVEERREEILNGPIVKTILVLALPVMVSSGLHTAFNIVDTYWLGKLGSAQVGAPTAAWPVMFSFLAIGMGLSTAGVSLVSQHTGAGGKEKANEAAGQVFGFILIIGLVAGIVGSLGAGWITRMIGTPPDVRPLATIYMRIVFMSMPFIFAYIGFRFLLRGVGDMITPMLIRAALVGVNIVLDPILIFGVGPIPAMGVKGAAVATATARITASLIGIYLLFNDKVNISLKLDDLRLKLRWFKKIVNIGAPATIARAGSAFGFIVLFSLVAGFGKNPVAAYGIGRRVVHVLTIGIWGFAGASMTMVGQNIGAEQKERAEEIVKKSILVSLAILFSLGILMVIFRRTIMLFFIGDMAVVNEGARYLAIFSLSIPFFGVYRIFDSTFRGTGHTKPAMVLSLFRIWGLRVFLSYLMAYPVFGYGLNMGVLGIWYGMAASNFLIAFLSFGYFMTGNWKRKTIDTSQ